MPAPRNEVWLLVDRVEVLLDLVADRGDGLPIAVRIPSVNASLIDVDGLRPVNFLAWIVRSQLLSTFCGVGSSSPFGRFTTSCQNVRAALSFAM